ncbi:multifunctional oxoglutarate decarboxylase/oxoglutarate dehydrogenase thiamine pyrophosphate-binding subunit/dihydrolipoyllysine-residue succinyltransferase subunit [Pseudactinotalea sp. HY158]|uniref:multifunctional oxoglutarate decarboxylase/oxoglutarate dehydrogenase thiamine pyrophosphate-binding subunit/dihydrolipoyllysine-residue succinyltransferase subunit n=1 Tax=Pseudactinotalea sp. HY158 TaxID=2654547 RepID=UPI00129C6BA8|nr:multifunctional oxoglutarate decarboxylase/oxoglutarate dehydrogenase thiamine pyrophosphate-binding subunit/dihydrolipoyllysine-residue succinyltransferase subunit [Pseudactinotalea sp. HY158]QGH68872.1 multifunctional oxoglutarate decarboxylase/oxoglutarate dehydrogenase thiamine pyrophosphate-binding subunit/dihydrolipoyllysine-residue succinyltransferase subunit [Pseudactinotalea sp. HY158]
MSAQAPNEPADLAEGFGGNEWLIDEQYERFLADPNSVDDAWREFFAEHRVADGAAAHPTGAVNTAGTAAPHPTGTANASTTANTSGSAGSAGSANAAGRASNGAPAQSTQPAQPAQSTRPAQPAQPTQPAPPAPVDSTSPAEPAPPAEPVAIAPTAPYASTVGVGGPRSAGGDDEVSRLRGPAARVVSNMETSLTVPTATSVRDIPAKLLVDNRIVLNNHLTRSRGGKVSFTHLIGFAVVEALADMPAMNAGYREVDGKPGVFRPAAVNLGLAIDLAKPDGTRQLLVPAIKDAQLMDFAQFWEAYEDVVRRARNSKLTVDDFAGTTISLTNPGTIGTVHSVPRLMSGQGTIIGVGAMNYPAEYQGAAVETIARLGVSKTLTLTSTYDHRVIQGAQSGEFLRIVHTKLLGQDGFYDRVFAALRVPYEPVRWTQDHSYDPAKEMGKPARIAELIHAHRSRGHLIADIDPLGYRQRRHPDLDVQSHGLTLWDLDRTFPTGGFGGTEQLPLRDILGLLRDSYCRTIGAEYMHLHEGTERRWLQRRLEAGWSKPDPREQLQILRKLNAAEAFETFLQTKFVGQKRFSLEGGESLIPLLDRVLDRAATEELDEVAIGMAHRGRLNVLANIAGKSYGQIFNEFEGNEDPRTVQGSGDVKYHLGTEGLYTSPSGGTTRVYLAANPSHLEAVNGVLEGVVRAKQDLLDLGGSGYSVLPILIHGDAAFAGQGVVAETLNMSQLRGYRTGGTVHVIVNNQIGFTTGANSSRSTVYNTDIAKGLQIPVFHVNGDDPEAVAHVAELAFDYRQEFNKDVIIDLVCYRRRGHNEGDDPSMTQPVMYSLIEDKPSVRTLYSQGLVGRGDITAEEAAEALKHFQSELERIFTGSREQSQADSDSVLGLEVPDSQREDAGVMVGWQSAVPAAVLARIGDAHLAAPEGFSVHNKLGQLLERRHKMSTEGGIDWGFGEVAAFGSLLMDGVPVRLAGQDSRRGTFVQRHLTLHDHENGAEWTPLMYLSKDQAKLWVYDSPLSEYAALAFEYGYSVERPDALVLWEAQFGDFVNGAQTVIDEFISSAEQKWGQKASLVMLLPHGYEGQGPDHSSARLERFLQLCAEQNMIVAQPSTPANHFHLLRRQAFQRPRHPLVVMTPKQLLRLKAASSAVADFTTGSFQPVLGDRTVADRSKVTRVLLCTGRFYYDLLSRRGKQERDDIALVRVEQLYPLPAEELQAELASYPNAEFVWAQDEPLNQGAWPFLALNLPGQVPVVGERGLRVAARPEGAAPSAGTMKLHKLQAEELLAAAFAR